MFIPDYRHLLNAARRQRPGRMPLYEHDIPESIMERVLCRPFSEYYDGPESQRQRYFNDYCAFFRTMGYDTVSFERKVALVLPDSGSTKGSSGNPIRTRVDLERYPFELMPHLFFERFGDDFKLLYEALPEGMRVVGGPACGIWEIALSLVGYSELCRLLNTDEKLFADIISAIGRMVLKIWNIFILRYSKGVCVFRVTDTLSLEPQLGPPYEAINRYVMPYYKNLVNLFHSAGKPVLLRGMGYAPALMDMLISFAGFDANHAQTTAMTPFSEWVRLYGERLALFGGIDTGLLNDLDADGVAALTESTVKANIARAGFAFGTAGGIEEDLPLDNYMVMIETARRFRGE